MLTQGRLGRDYAHPGVGPYPLIPEINTYDYGLVKVSKKLKWNFFLGAIYLGSVVVHFLN